MQDTPRNPKNGSSIPAKTDNPTAKAGLDLLTRRWIPIAGVIAVVAAGAAYAYWRHAVLYPSTDDAYVRASIVQVAPLVTGVVSDVKVASYARVKSGDVLFSVDPAPFNAALKKAESRLTAAQQQAQGGPGQPNAKAAVEQAQAAVEEARAELDHATVKAPVEGTVGKVQIAKGSIVKAGMVALPLVDTSSYWVDANFKETESRAHQAGPTRDRNGRPRAIRNFAGQRRGNQPGKRQCILPAAVRKCDRQLGQGHTTISRERFDPVGRGSSRIADRRLGDRDGGHVGTRQCQQVSFGRQPLGT